MHEERDPKPRTGIRGTAREKSASVFERELELHAKGVVDTVKYVPQIERAAAAVHGLHPDMVFFIDHDADALGNVAYHAPVALSGKQIGADKLSSTRYCCSILLSLEQLKLL